MDYKSITTEELEQMVRQKGQKDGEALCELGERYLYGKNGTMANPTKAGRLFEKAEKLGTASKPVIFYGDFSGLAIKETESMEIQILLEKFATQHAIGVVGYSELDAKVENTQKIAVAVSGATDPASK